VTVEQGNRKAGTMSRRRLLGVGCGLAAGALLPWRGAFAYSDAKTLGFKHLHTGEELSAVFWSQGRYNEDGLAELKHIMRDWRTEQTIEIDRMLYQLLFDIRNKVGTDQPFQIISAYRSPKTNLQLRQNSDGVAKKSLHMQGMAIDVRLPGYSTKGLQQLALKMHRGGVGYYGRSDFVHLDTGRPRSWVG
jgi:uncharacterized protein YcbK (DUF882 family)